MIEAIVLNALCDRLETSFIAAVDTLRRLFDALLAESLAFGKEVPEEMERVASHE